MFLELNTFESFMTLFAQMRQVSRSERTEIHVDGEESQAAVVSPSEQVDSFGQGLADATGEPDLASKIIGKTDSFPVLRVTVTSHIVPFPMTRLDSEGRPQSDVDQMRYETWVSLSDQVPIGRTAEFANQQDLAEALRKARTVVGLEITYSSERIRKLLARTAST